MNRWSLISQSRLETCHVDLIRLFNTVLEVRDCSILCGKRGAEEQTEAFRTGKSKLEFPDSNHNKTPSLAADVVPYPVPNWETEGYEFIRFAHFVLGVAHGMGIDLRWGGDWDRDFDMTDQRFNDYPHFELV